MKKRQDIELLRIVSAFGIVWFHSGAKGHELAYAGLTVFLILSTYFARSEGNARTLLRRRFERLLIPWLFWFALYGALNLARGAPVLPSGEGTLAALLSGPSIHLWYMPFIFVSLSALDAARRHLPRRAIALASALIALSILASTPLWRPYSLDLGQPWAQYAHASAAIFIGAFLLHFDTLPKTAGWPLLLLMCGGAALMTPYPGVGLPYMAALALGCFLASDVRAPTLPIDVTPLSECTLGIYFIHVLFLRGLVKFGLAHGAGVPVGAFFLSALTVFFLRRAAPGWARYWS